MTVRKKVAIDTWHPPRALVACWLALLGLLTLTVGASFFPIGVLNTVLALLIAVGKALIVAVVFMELQGQRSLVIVFAGAGFYWLGIMLWLAFADFLTRSEIVQPPF